MSFALLWIEVLLVSLLWVAMLSPFASRARRSGNRRLALLLALLTLLVVTVVLLFVGTGPFLEDSIESLVGRRSHAINYAVLAVAAIVGIVLALRVREIGTWQGIFVVAIGLPLLFLGAAMALAALFHFSSGFDATWFWYTVTLFGAFIVGAMCLLIAATRPTEAGAWRSATWPRNRLIVSWIAAVTLTLMTLWNMDLEARASAAVLRVDAGTLLLSVSPPPVSDSLNAAVIYEKAFARLKDDKVLEEALKHRELEDLDEQTLVAVLAKHQRTFALLRQGASLPECRFEHDYARPSISMLLPELNRARAAARLLAIDARHELAAGHVERATEDVKAILSLSHGISREPLIIGLLVSYGIDEVAVKLLMETLPAVTTKSQLAGIELSDSQSLRRQLGRSLEGEEAFGLSLFGDIGSGQVKISNVMSSPSHSPVSPDVWPIAPLMRIFSFSDDLAQYRGSMEQYRALADRPYHQVKPSLDQVENPNLGHRAPLTSGVLPALSRTFFNCARTQISHWCATVAIAATHYRLDHGSYPAKLEDLTPNYLDEVPIDPFDGKPLRYAVRANDVIFYSVGPDGKDDGGAPYDHKTSTGDISWQMKLAPPRPATQPAAR